MPTVAELCAELSAEQEALDALVAGIDGVLWATATPADDWNVADTVSHLAFFDRAADLALGDPEAFEQHKALILEAQQSLGVLPLDLVAGRELAPSALLASWRSARAGLVQRAHAADPRARVAWFAPPMGVTSFISARLMETWAHGQDIVDTLAAEPIITDRLRHVCHLSLATREWSFFVHGIEDPASPVYVELIGPSAEVWTWGPPDAADRITGPAVDLAALFTQRRHRSDTELVAIGPTAELWLMVAQAYAGPVGPGRAPGLGMLRTPPTAKRG
jgi:uncharacterized protein (TIGR03084 family)